MSNQRRYESESGSSRSISSGVLMLQERGHTVKRKKKSSAGDGQPGYAKTNAIAGGGAMAFT